MKRHPITAPRDYYRGREPGRLRKQQQFNRVAALVERHINALVAKWPNDTTSSILSYEVASDLGEDSDLVHRIIFGIDGGSNGVTIYKGNFDRAVDNPGAPD